MEGQDRGQQLAGAPQTRVGLEPATLARWVPGAMGALQHLVLKSSGMKHWEAVPP